MYVDGKYILCSGDGSEVAAGANVGVALAAARCSCSCSCYYCCVLCRNSVEFVKDAFQTEFFKK